MKEQLLGSENIPLKRQHQKVTQLDKTWKLLPKNEIFPVRSTCEIPEQKQIPSASFLVKVFENFFDET